LWLGPVIAPEELWLGRFVNRLRSTRSLSLQTQTIPAAQALLVLPFVAPSLLNAEHVVERQLFSRSFISSRQLYLLLISLLNFLFVFGSGGRGHPQNCLRHRAE
jgi:hypothetical protein